MPPRNFLDSLQHVMWFLHLKYFTEIVIRLPKGQHMLSETRIATILWGIWQDQFIHSRYGLFNGNTAGTTLNQPFKQNTKMRRRSFITNITILLSTLTRKKREILVFWTPYCCCLTWSWLVSCDRKLYRDCCMRTKPFPSLFILWVCVCVSGVAYTTIRRFNLH